MGEDLLKTAYGIDEMEGNVKILVKEGDSSVTLSSQITGKGEGFVDLIPLTYEGKTLSFRGEGLIIKLQAIKESLHIEFKLSKVELIKVSDGSVVHRAYSNEKSKCKNLRACKRFSLGEVGTVQFGAGQKVIDCIVKDISYGGFGLAVKGKESVPEKKMLNVRFECKIGVVPLSIHTNGLVARTQYNDDRDETIIGVQLLSKNVTVQEAVNQIQRQELQKLRH
ncbi:MAG: PilZ domain-containing protein [Lachnospiraceae bacterium]|nr:PilZ domain-containing protein [Lachnospiraceae bacterium]